MKYIVQIEVDPEVGNEVEGHPEDIQKVVGAWQAHNPLGMYFYLNRRAITVILEAPDEDTFFDALHATWVVTESYPEVSPVVDDSEFPALLQRVGVTGKQ